jgi:hypothetical protein
VSSNPNAHNPDPDGAQSPSEYPIGFIFGTYSAAKEDYPKAKSLSNSPNQAYAYLSSTIGGSTSIVSFEGTQKEDRVRPPSSGGGIRGKITGLSKASRRNLLRLLASIDYTSIEGKVFFASLSYAEIWPEDPRACKEHLEAFRKRLRTKFGVFPAVWRLGIQERGAWHFHLLLFLPSSSGSLKEVRQFVATSWYEACGRISEGHLLAGTNVGEIRSPRRVDYVGRYLAKKEVFSEGLETGRVWGVWNRKLLPVHWETLKVSVEDGYKLRRIFRRLAKKKGTRTLRKLQVFVRHENIVRLLEFLKDNTEHPKGARRPLPPRESIPQRHTSGGCSSGVAGDSVSRRKEEN